MVYRVSIDRHCVRLFIAVVKTPQPFATIGSLLIVTPLGLMSTHVVEIIIPHQYVLYRTSSQISIQLLFQIYQKPPFSILVALKEYKQVYERILEMDKRLDIAKKQLQVSEERERKLQREMVKGSKAASVTQDKLQQAVDAKNLAQTEC